MTRAIIILLTTLFTTSTFAAWNNFSINYDKDRNRFGSHTWQIAAYDNDWVYFANNKGLLQFNNREWDLFTLKHTTELRSIKASTEEGRIYVGGINEFGFYSANESGAMRYSCLSDSLTVRELNVELGNIWNIDQIDQTLYFQGDTKILKYTQRSASVIDAHKRVYSSAVIKGVLHLGLEDGIYMLVGEDLLKRVSLDESEIPRSIVQIEQRTIIVTSKSLYLYDEQRGKITPYESCAEDFIKRSTLFCAATSGSLLALGSINSGIVVIDTHTNQVKHFNHDCGLQSNTVLALAFDSERLWVGLDGGIDCIDLNPSLTNLYSPDEPLGAGYTAIMDGNYLYLGTNLGLYYIYAPFNAKTNQLHGAIKFASASGQVWRLARLGEDVFSLQDAGAYHIKGRNIEVIKGIREAWSLTSIPPRGAIERGIIGTNDGAYVVEKRAGRWQLSHRIEGINGMCYQIYFDSDDQLWIYDALHAKRVRLDKEYRAAIEQQRYEIVDDDGKVNQIRTTSRVDDTIYFVGSSSLYKYDGALDKLVEATDFSHTTPMNDSTIGFYSLGDKRLYLGDKQIFITDSSESVQTIDLIDDVSILRNSEGLVTVGESQVIITHENGFALLDIDNYDSSNNGGNSVAIKSIYITNPTDSLIYSSNYLSRRPSLELPYSDNSLRFESSTNDIFRSNSVEYQYRLNNEEWSSASSRGVKEYNNIRSGSHRFHVRAIFGNGDMSSTHYDFVILPPIYMSKEAYMLYALLAVLSILLFYRFMDHLVRRKKRQIAEAKDAEIESQRERFEIEKIEQELRHKGQELTNLMVSSVSRNELFSQVKDEIKQCKRAVDHEPSEIVKQMLANIESRMDSNITSENTLKKIEEEFDLVHDNFIKQLEIRHPNLNYNEKMMCAYLKMGLSTKEIAPLLNISTRGLETVRYRIRKKFGLERQDSLRKYLHSELK